MIDRHKEGWMDGWRDRHKQRQMDRGKETDTVDRQAETDGQIVELIPVSIQRVLTL